MFRSLVCVAGTAFLVAFTVAPVRAEVKPTIKDRFDQIIATFMGDPAAGVDIDLKHVLDTWRGMDPMKFELQTA